MTDNEREAIAILQHTGRFYGQVSNLIKLKDEDYNPIKNRIRKVQKEEYLIKNACYSVTKYYLCRQNNKRSLLGRKQQSQVARSFPNRYLFSYADKVTPLFSISCILDIIFECKTSPFTHQKLTFFFACCKCLSVNALRKQRRMLCDCF